MLSKCRDTWSALIPDFRGDDWDDMWNHSFGALLLAQDRLIQFKLLHRVYYTPARMAQLSAGDAPPILQTLTIYSSIADRYGSFGRGGAHIPFKAY